MVIILDINCDYYMEIIDDNIWTIKIIPDDKVLLL